MLVVFCKIVRAGELLGRLWLGNIDYLLNKYSLLRCVCFVFQSRLLAFSKSSLTTSPSCYRWLVALIVLVSQGVCHAVELPSVDALATMINKPTEVITVIEPHLSSAHLQTRVQYRGWRVEDVLKQVLGVSWKESGTAIEFRAADGYVSRIPVQRFAQYKAYLVFERVGHQRFSVDNLNQQQKQVSLGPYYLIWDNIEEAMLVAEGATYWPYQVIAISISTTQLQALLPKGMPAGNWSGSVALTQQYCLSCHQVNAYGGDKWPGNLAQQARKMRQDEFVRWILEPRSVKPNTTMPGMAESASEIQRNDWAQQIYQYLRAVPILPTGGL